MGKFFVCRLSQHTQEGCDPDISRQEDRGLRGVLVQRQRAARPVDMYSGTERHALEHPLESAVTHSGRNRELVFKWGTCDGECADVPFGVGFIRVQ